MSRTYRRKNAEWEIQWELQQSVKKQSKYGGTYWDRIKVPHDHPHYQKTVNEYHRDKDRVFRYGVPSWFANIYSERKRRVTTRNKIVKWMRNPDEDLVLDNFRHHIAYDWF